MADGTYTPNQIAYRQGLLYATGRNGDLNVFNSTYGFLYTDVEMAGSEFGGPSSGPVIDRDGNVYVVSNDGYVTKYNVNTGVQWTHNLNMSVTGQPVYKPGSPYMYIAIEGENNPNDGFIGGTAGFREFNVETRSIEGNYTPDGASNAAWVSPIVTGDTMYGIVYRNSQPFYSIYGYDTDTDTLIQNQTLPEGSSPYVYRDNFAYYKNTIFFAYYAYDENYTQAGSGAKITAFRGELGVDIEAPETAAVNEDIAVEAITLGNATTYEWDFGDGTTKTTTTPTVEHSYTSSGTYTIQLTPIRGSKSATATTQISIKSASCNESDAFSNMSQTASGEYKVTNICQLQSISVDPSADYVITENINASSSQYWNQGDGFKPISNFNGSLDGQNNRITGLEIKRSGNSSVGLFKNLEGDVSNIEVADSIVFGEDSTGIIAGRATSISTISSISIEESNVEGESKTGGVVGYSQGMVSDISVDSATTVTGKYRVGGSVGEQVGGVVRNVETSADVEGEWAVSPTIGASTQGTDVSDIRVSNANSESTNYGSVGGAVGYSWNNVTISDVRVIQSRMTATGCCVGGAVGGMYGNSALEDAYISDSVIKSTGESSVGGASGSANTVINATVLNSKVFAEKGDVGGVIGEGSVVKDSFAKNIEVSSGKYEVKNHGGIAGYVYGVFSNNTAKDISVNTVDGYNIGLLAGKVRGPIVIQGGEYTTELTIGGGQYGNNIGYLFGHTRNVKLKDITVDQTVSAGNSNTGLLQVEHITQHAKIVRLLDE